MATATNDDLKKLLLGGDPAFWERLAVRTREAAEFDELFFLSSLRKKAHKRGVPLPSATPEKLRLALVGGYSLYPLHELLEHFLETQGAPVELFVGDYDNFTSEITDGAGRLHAFRPQVLFFLPSARFGKYPGQLTDPRAAQEAEARRLVQHLLDLCRTAHERMQCEVALANFVLPARHDPGPYRSRTLGSDWNFRKLVNLELGLAAPPYVHICDLEFLANRRGAHGALDDRAWFESKQPGSPAFLVDFSRELAQLILSLRRPPKKVLVLDLDNTLWGGVVADDGLEGIEVGDTSPRGEAFKAFQRYVKSLKDRGVLLAVCSKNDHAKAAEPFEKHPEMVLQLSDFAAFTANWEPKSDNLRRMAAELKLGLDSFVFVDDNPAEVDIVRQFAPEVTAIYLGPDPAEYLATLQDCRLFEPRSITADDLQRTTQYRSEQERQSLLASVTDMDAYLASLAMEGVISEFTALDAPRLSQLINKSNQFNLTTRRRTEAEVLALLGDAAYVTFSMRLKDRFGDHGLISIVIGHKQGTNLEIDTWLMSCRVLKRQVEEEVLNELARLARAQGCTRLIGVYLPTAKNEMVKDHYPRFGFATVSETPPRSEYALDVTNFQPVPTKIKILRRAYEPS
ncbi:MAG: HAD-IIIC family phosphatase [Verrucomicrobia bacterium]|nr:HAD-IIIC family phosphatase [Verrucomicrobiota bacterium]